jgi:hypothetical protein
MWDNHWHRIDKWCISGHMIVANIALKTIKYIQMWVKLGNWCSHVILLIHINPRLWCSQTETNNALDHIDVLGWKGPRRLFYSMCGNCETCLLVKCCIFQIQTLMLPNATTIYRNESRTSMTSLSQKCLAEVNCSWLTLG